ncbi:uncharacterized protein K452DRAFT_7606 [Aplosporella prunicola CBS 121167]|uniref:Uncharacterized protein n=1 Tax=Aplosporella prunicola CBS 121167 TaxID=1176127 RepID=A0A6A6BTX1_9PEZI|nr:uncharacterized protein K452DRAFT_7606 [Aplosporella prunicola CBS 121167]KAF2147440.1 hypothetical protein K452DRAFT_7606 [Aplosporella prunicola CBS 121167]
MLATHDLRREWGREWRRSMQGHAGALGWCADCERKSGALDLLFFSPSTLPAYQAHFLAGLSFAACWGTPHFEGEGKNEEDHPSD